jgi:hypothetical protein
MSDINIADYCFDEAEVSVKQPKQSSYQAKHDGRFMCVPELWAIKVFRVARKSQSPGPVIVGLILWQKYRMQHGRQPFTLTNPMLHRFGLGRHFFSKWLAVLEKAGLVSAQRFKHRSPLITILAE